MSRVQAIRTSSCQLRNGLPFSCLIICIIPLCCRHQVQLCTCKEYKQFLTTPFSLSHTHLCSPLNALQSLLVRYMMHLLCVSLSIQLQESSSIAQKKLTNYTLFNNKYMCYTCSASNLQSILYTLNNPIKFTNLNSL